jgi:hypothetical protein
MFHIQPVFRGLSVVGRGIYSPASWGGRSRKTTSIILSANPEWQVGHPGIFSRAGKLFERQRVLAGPGKDPGVAEPVIMARKIILK